MTTTALLPGEGWILLMDFCRKYGQTPNVVQKRVHDGAWARGEYYSVPSAGDGYIHEARARAWLEERGKLPAGV